MEFHQYNLIKCFGQMQEKSQEQFLQDFNQYSGVELAKKIEESYHFNQYKQFFPHFEQDRFEDAQFSSFFIQILKKNQIKFSRRLFAPFAVNIISNLPNQEIADIELQWGYYKLRATIIKNEGESIFHRCQSSHGSLAKVFKVEDQREPFVVKCVSTKIQNFEDKIKMQKCALREYFIFRITSALGCGPQMKKSFGFDLLFSENCIEFAMEYCSEIKSMSQKIVNRLKESLLTLHQASIVHFDIKPDNLMWSNHFKKEVFVDFGLSEVFNGGPGFKYPVNFKGSLNFCSQQMSQFLISQNQRNLLDVYHNDVNCLRETILAYQNNKILQVSHDSNDIYDEYPPHPIQMITNERIKFQEKLKIILLKYFLLVKNSQKIDKVFQGADKSLLFSGEIINFTKNIYSTQEFKDFYERYITDSVKDSVQYGWINIWTKSIYSKMLTTQAQNSQIKGILQSIGQLIDGLSNMNSKNISHLSRENLQIILFGKEAQDFQLYFYSFLSYISFINNYHQIDTSKKINAIEAFIQLFLPQFSNNRYKNIKVSFSENLIEILRQIFRYILCYYVNASYEAKQTIIDNINRLELILDIFQHVFFFALFSAQETIDLLKKVYILKLWSQQQRMEIIIRINNINDWNIIDLFQNISINHLAIENWVNQRILDFKRQKLTPSMQIVFSIFQFKSDKNDLYLLDYQPFKSFSPSFKIQFWLSNFIHELFIKDKLVIIKLMKFIEDHFPQNQRKRIYPIYLHLFTIFSINYSNRDESWSICQLFKQHLRFDELFDSLIFYRIVKMQKAMTAQEKIRQLTQIVKVIRYENSGFLMAILSGELKNVLTLTQQIQIQKLFAQFGMLQLVNSLKSVLLRFNFKTKGKSLVRKCDNQKHLYYYFTLQFTIHLLIRKNYDDLSDDINQLQTIIKNQKCQRCQLNMYYQFFQLKIEESIYIRPQDVGQYLIQIFHSYNQFEKLIGDREISGQIRYVDRVLKTYNSITHKLVDLQYINSKVLNIFYKLYRFCKHRNIIERYFQSRYISTVISYCLQAVSQIGGFQQLADFLGDIFNYIRYTENVLNINSICWDFRLFIEDYLIKEKPQLLIQIINYLHNYERRQPYVATFYYAFLFAIQNNFDRLAHIIRIFNLIQFMPLKISSFFEASLYCFMLYKDQNILQLIMNKTETSDNHHNFSLTIIRRRQERIKRKLIKLIHNIQYALFDRGKSSKKQIKTKRVLLQKCRNLGSYMMPAYPKKILYINPIFLA